ncbi:MAG: 8-oxo-dGTP diphosphatase [Nanoarchaeota archaeon]
MKQCTLCFLFDDANSRMLMGLKIKGFGAGKINAFGGKQDPGETIEHAACTELLEETGMIVDQAALEKVAEIAFYFPNPPAGKTWDHYVHVYIARKFSGTPTETDEMRPAWFALDKIPYEKMWKADATFLPLLLEGKKFRAVYTFADDCENIAKHEITHVDGL